VDVFCGFGLIFSPLSDSDVRPSFSSVSRLASTLLKLCDMEWSALSPGFLTTRGVSPDSHITKESFTWSKQEWHGYIASYHAFEGKVI